MEWFTDFFKDQNGEWKMSKVLVVAAVAVLVIFELFGAGL